jgi:two-component system cell cycle response regulator
MKVLIADDDPGSRLLLSHAVAQWGFEAITVDDGEKALAALQADEAPALVILDWMMPGIDGPEICRQLRARNDDSGAYTYILMLTSRSDKDDVVDGLTAGADDYVVKPVRLPELKARLRVGRRILDLESKLRAERSLYQQRAMHDPLTGIWNRRTVLEGLDKELDRARRERRCVTVVMFDLDGFKAINDSHGHPVGDEVLVETGRRWSAGLRSYDLLGRMGGEEFLAVPTCRNTAEAADLAERLRLIIADSPFDTSAGPLSVTVSIGVATSETEGHSAAALLIAADRALYRAKHAGRNRVEVKRTISASSADLPVAR